LEYTSQVKLTISVRFLFAWSVQLFKKKTYPFVFSGRNKALGLKWQEEE